MHKGRGGGGRGGQCLEVQLEGQGLPGKGGLRGQPVHSGHGAALALVALLHPVRQAAPAALLHIIHVTHRLLHGHHMLHFTACHMLYAGQWCAWEPYPLGSGQA